MVKFGSLFAGIGGIDLGLERAGMRCVWQVEIDLYCQKVLAKHWPNVRRRDDVRECGANNLDPVDLICGGFPCQDISYAGKGAGIEGERSGLWKEFYRIICELRPRYVLVENVPALLRRGLDVVLGDLASCGYDAEWESLPAAAFGAPHIRERVFIVAYATDNGFDALRLAARIPAQRQSFDRKLVRSDYAADVADTDQYREKRDKSKDGQGQRIKQSSQDAAGTDSTRQQTRGKRDITERQEQFAGGDVETRAEWLSEPNVGRVVNGVPSRVDRLRCLGNAVVPQVAEWIGRQILGMVQSKEM